MKKVESLKEAIDMINASNILVKIPTNSITDEIQCLIIKSDGISLRAIPKKYISDDFLVECVKTWNYAIHTIPKEFVTEKLKLLHENLWVL